MKLILLTVVFTLISVVAKASSHEMREVEKFFAGFTRALNAKDLDLIQTSWKIDGEAFTLAGGLAKGSDKIRALYSKAFAGPYKNAEFQYIIQNVRITGEKTAVVDGVWKEMGGPPNYPSCGIFLFNLSKNNGRWQIDLAYSSVPHEGHTADLGRTVNWREVCRQ